MKFQELQRLNEQELQGRTGGAEVLRVSEQMESELPLQCLVTWPASIHCGRCHGLMYRIQLRDWGGSRGQDGCDALQCIACGDIIDPIIVKHRRGSEQSPIVRRKTRDGSR